MLAPASIPGSDGYLIYPRKQFQSQNDPSSHYRSCSTAGDPGKHKVARRGVVRNGHIRDCTGRMRHLWEPAVIVSDADFITACVCYGWARAGRHQWPRARVVASLGPTMSKRRVGAVKVLKCFFKLLESQQPCSSVFTFARLRPLSVYLSRCLSVYLSANLSVCQSVCRESVCLFVCLSICLTVCLSVCLSE